MPVKSYKQPILSLVLRVFGLLAAAIALVALGVMFIAKASGSGAAGFLVSLPLLISAIVSALFLFGVAQIIDYLGRTAAASEEAAENSEASANLLRQLLRSYGHEPEA